MCYSWLMKICVPIQVSTQKEVIKRLHQVAKQADLAEIWLDQIKDLNLKTLLKAKPLPVVCVCKRPADKGKFKGSFEELSRVLLEAIKFGANYVDIPLNMPEKLSKKVVQEARKKKCKVIVSYHDFEGTPDYPKLVKMTQKMTQKGANVVKLASMTRDLQDMVDIISLGKYLEGSNTRHILIAMGQKGILSRTLTPTLGGEMMFATLGKKGQTAPGQLSVKELKRAWSLIKPK